MTGEFDVVIVAYASCDVIGTCVEHACALDGVGDVVVVDHGTDGSGGLARAAGARVLTDPMNPGFGAGQNRGVAVTTAPFVLLLNPDAEPDPVGIKAGREALHDNPLAAAVQGVVVNRVTGEPERSHGCELGPVHLVGRAMGARKLLGLAPVRYLAGRVGRLSDHVERVPIGIESVETLAATALLVRRDAFESVNGFDSSYFLYGEDLDLCRRLRSAGWSLLALPERTALHTSGASAGSNTERELNWWRGTLRFAALSWSETAWLAARVASVIEVARLSVPTPRVFSRAWRELITEPGRDRRGRLTVR